MMELINMLVALFAYGATISFFSSVVVCSVGFYYVVRLCSSARACIQVLIKLDRLLKSNPELMARKNIIVAEIITELNYRVAIDSVVLKMHRLRTFWTFYYGAERCMMIFYTTFGEFYMIHKRTADVEAELFEATEAVRLLNLERAERIGDLEHRVFMARAREYNANEIMGLRA